MLQQLENTYNFLIKSQIARLVELPNLFKVRTFPQQVFTKAFVLLPGQLFIHILPVLAVRFVAFIRIIGSLQIETNLYSIIFRTPAKRFILADGRQILGSKRKLLCRNSKVMRHSRYATCCMLCGLYRTFLFQNIYILAPSKLYVIYKYMRNSYFVLIVYYGNFFLHHPVVYVYGIVGSHFIVIFDNCPDLDSRQ